MANVELLNQVVDYTLSADNWFQERWCTYDPECGTAMCVAGFAAIVFGGYEPTYYTPRYSGDFVADYVETEHGMERIPDVAKRMLELTSLEASHLFYEDVDDVELKVIAEQIAQGDIKDDFEPPNMMVDVASINW